MPIVGRVVSPLLSASEHDSNWEYLFRFVSGYWMNGRAKTNATFLRDATQPIGVMPAGRWSWLAWWKRAAVRLGLITVALMLLVGRVFYYDTLATVLRLLLWTIGPTLIIAMAVRMGRHSTKRDYHATLTAWYAHKFGVPTWQAAKMISIPKGHTKSADNIVTIWWPLGFSIPASDRDKWAELVANMLGLTDPDYKFSFTGRPSMTMALVPRPPSDVNVEDFSSHVHKRNSTRAN